jgi:hypothetical protein
MISTRAVLAEAAFSPFHRFLDVQPFTMLPDFRVVSLREFLKGGVTDDRVPATLSGRFLAVDDTAVPDVNAVINQAGTVHYNMVTPHHPTPRKAASMPAWCPVPQESAERLYAGNPVQ